MKSVDINGEAVPVREAAKLIKMLCDDAREFAGQFHNMNRSIKFRTNWPDEDVFAASEWKSFVAAVRDMYTARLSDPSTSPEDKDKIFKALILERMVASEQETDNRLQLRPNTQQFVGDPWENRKIVENYGTAPNFRAQLRAGAAKILGSLH